MRGGGEGVGGGMVAVGHPAMSTLEPLHAQLTLPPADKATENEKRVTKRAQKRGNKGPGSLFVKE